jgi:hypothetical protein
VKAATLHRSDFVQQNVANTKTNTIRYPIHHALLAESTTQELEPTCYTSAMKDLHWRHAINVEFDAPLQNHT